MSACDYTAVVPSSSMRRGHPAKKDRLNDRGHDGPEDGRSRFPVPVFLARNVQAETKEASIGAPRQKWPELCMSGRDDDGIIKA